MANSAPHPSFSEPTNKHIKMWRYLDAAKLVSTIQHGALFFPRAALLGDSFEGSRPVPNKQYEDYVLKFRHSDERLAVFRRMTDQQLVQLFAAASEERKKNLHELLVSCWHMNEYESAAMWKLYAKSVDAVCIQTTFQRLKDHLPAWVHLGEVKYIDYEYGTIPEDNMFNFIMYKRSSFDHERELRGVAWVSETQFKQSGAPERLDEGGLWVDVNLSALLDAIYVSPQAQPWFVDMARSLVDKYKLSIAVHQSSLDRHPVF
jgi:hypothetical protein